MWRKLVCRLGVVPIGKFAFSHEDAMRQKEKLLLLMREWGVEFVDVDLVIEDGMLRSTEQVPEVVAYLREQDIDALFIPHCNFGTEDATGMLCRALNIPTLLWGPRDENPLADGSRLRDSLCGCFATSKVLHTLGITYHYIESCDADSTLFRDGLQKFVAAVRVRKALQTARIGQIGMRIPFFWCTIGDEAAMLKRFGVQVYPFDMVELIERYHTRYKKKEQGYRAELKDMRAWLRTDAIPEEGMLLSLALRDELFAMAEQHHIDAFALQNFDSLQYDLGPGSGLGIALAEERLPIAAETDIMGALSSVLIEAAAGDGEPSFFPEFTIRHPENDNAVLLWHASAAPSLRDPKQEKVYFEPPWILKSLPATSLQFALKQGELTCCRLDGNEGVYQLGVGQGYSIAGLKTREVHAWMQVSDWPRWERKLIEGPFIHHTSAHFGHHADVLEETCRLIPGLDCIRFDRA